MVPVLIAVIGLYTKGTHGTAAIVRSRSVYPRFPTFSELPLTTAEKLAQKVQRFLEILE